MDSPDRVVASRTELSSTIPEPADTYRHTVAALRGACRLRRIKTRRTHLVANQTYQQNDNAAPKSTLTQLLAFSFMAVPRSLR